MYESSKVSKEHLNSEKKGEKYSLQFMPIKQSQNSVIQRATTLVYASPNMRPLTDKISGMNHTRVDHTDWHRNEASKQSGYGPDHTDAPGTCNHAVPYKMIKDHVGTTLSTSPKNTVNDAATFVNGLAGSYSCPGLFTFGSGTLSEVQINSSVDTLISNAANDVRNLFYWPDHTGDSGGTAIDKPKGVGSRAGGVDQYRKDLAIYENKLRTDGLIP